MDPQSAEGYKLFSDDNLPAIIFERLGKQLVESGACAPDASVKLCRKHFAEKGWQLWDEKWLGEKLQLMYECGYENEVSAVVTKLLLRGKVEWRPPPSYSGGSRR